MPSGLNTQLPPLNPTPMAYSSFLSGVGRAHAGAGGGHAAGPHVRCAARALLAARGDAGGFVQVR